MKFSLNWLKDYVDIKTSPGELADQLTMVGLEIEAIDYIGDGLGQVVVAEILDIKPHPNASKLVLCTVRDDSKHYNVVCGAKNMKVSDKVALAIAGAKLSPSAKYPDGILIKSTKIRGKISEGMLCAENELGLGEQDEGILILPDTAKVGSPLSELPGIKDVVLEIGVTPNRSDCLSLVGIARETAAILGTGIKYPNFKITETGEDINSLASVEVVDPQGCPRYSCRVITDLNITSSPDWLIERLEKSGIRSINNIVDITNFVQLELGQPLHAFDYDLIKNNMIIVRSAKDQEVIKTLDGVDRKLADQDLLICDSEKPIALAGVMGGGLYRGI